MKSILKVITFVMVLGSLSQLYGAAPAGVDLIRAAEHGDIDRVQLLLDARAEVNEVNAFGYTALMLAARERHKEIVELLLKYGAKVNTVDHLGYTILMLAVKGEDKKIVRMLLDAGADKKVKDIKHQTAEQIARDMGLDEIANLICDYWFGKSTKGAGRLGQRSNWSEDMGAAGASAGLSDDDDDDASASAAAAAALSGSLDDTPDQPEDDALFDSGSSDDDANEGFFSRSLRSFFNWHGDSKDSD